MWRPGPASPTAGDRSSPPSGPTSGEPRPLRAPTPARLTCGCADHAGAHRPGQPRGASGPGGGARRPADAVAELGATQERVAQAKRCEINGEPAARGDCHPAQGRYGPTGGAADSSNTSLARRGAVTSRTTPLTRLPREGRPWWFCWVYRSPTDGVPLLNTTTTIPAQPALLIALLWPRTSNRSEGRQRRKRHELTASGVMVSR